VTKDPDALEWLIIQNSNAYEIGFTAAWDGLRNALWKHRSAETEEPLTAFLARDTIKTIYLHGAKRPELVSPDAWESDIAFMQRPHAERLNLDLFYDYRTNVPLYPAWQAFLRERRPATIHFWGQDDIFFTKEGGDAYLADLPDAELHRLQAGHFAVEDHLDYIASHTKRFYVAKVAGAASAATAAAGARILERRRFTSPASGGIRSNPWPESRSTRLAWTRPASRVTVWRMCAAPRVCGRLGVTTGCSGCAGRSPLRGTRW